MSSLYTERIPNNVDLAGDRRLLRALVQWQPNFLSWWHEMGPEGATAHEIYLRTAVSVDAQGWAQFDFVKMPDYRWGIFLATPEADRRIAFGEHMGEPVWQEVPGEYRSTLRRLLVVQGDTEPASVEQQRFLGHTCPSLYDLRNLFQVNVEEGRHLWAMVYLLHAFFGRDGREEAETLLQRHSGDPEHPRILGAFNEKTAHWLDYLMFTFFTDRDGKYQLASLAESAFDPLSRTCSFMLTEEAHHMFVGETGIMRVVERTCQIMDELSSDDPERVREAGGIDLPTLQKFINFHYSASLDLFGQELSTNAANYYTAGLKGRYRETHIADDHRLLEGTQNVMAVRDGRIVEEEHPALAAVNERLREDYIRDCERGLRRWNEVIRAHGYDQLLRLPHRGFNRRIGSFSTAFVTPEGDLVDQAAWERHAAEWLPTPPDHAFIATLMGRVVDPERIAGWIAPPARGTDGKPWNYQYVRFA